MVSMDDASQAELQACDKVVIGASIRYGRHRKSVTKYINENQSALENKKSAFFSVNVVARKPEKCTPETNPYLKKFLTQISWKPLKLGVFAGKIDYQKYHLFDRYMILLIMWITKGPTDLQGVFEFTDWDKVSEFADSIDRL